MTLGQLIKSFDAARVHGQMPGGRVRGLAYDSRRVRPGTVFAALKGEAADGHDFVAQAARAGALAAIVEEPVEAAKGLCQIQAPDSRLALALAADRFYGSPSLGMTMVGITGTNGKTTVSYLTEAVLGLLGPAGVIGTVEMRYQDRKLPAPTTTPESVDLQSVLADMLQAGVAGAAMEVSSHALTQHRASGAAFDVGVFTNLSRDHLDYHGDMRSYLAAKLRLFTELLPASAQRGKRPAAVICASDPHSAQVAAACAERGVRVITYAMDADADVSGDRAQSGLDGGSMAVMHPGGETQIKTPLVGRFNLENILGAFGVGLALGLEPERIGRALETVIGVPGRLERVHGIVGSSCPAVFVDYCHTPDALAGALGVLRPLAKGRLICVFGAGGDRDQGKRPLMGRAAGENADVAVLTSDNPRNEDPLAIMDMIRPGLEQAGMSLTGSLNGQTRRAYLSQPDRAMAIKQAVDWAGPDDVVLIGGKGHEDYQITGGVKRYFDDRKQAAEALADRLGRGGI